MLASRFLLACSLLLVASTTSAAEVEVGTQKPGEFSTEVTLKVDMRYLLFLPEEYDQKESWPLILFLHGAGERGSDLEKLKKHGLPKIVEKQKDFPFIVVSPQCPEREYWQPEPLAKLVDEIASKYKVDRDRVYLTGLSMGGFGTFALAAAHPEKFAAIAPICGGGDPRTATRLKDLPTWVFHGAKDEVVPITHSEAMVQAIKAAGGNPEFTVYPEAEHDSWTETYENPKLYEWFMKHRMSDRKPGGSSGAK